jgi:hypothetical protein
MIPYRKFLQDGRKWRLVSSLGFLDGDETKPAVGLEVRPEQLGKQARIYLQPDIPVIRP